jgi:hypothetical protein
MFRENICVRARAIGEVFKKTKFSGNTASGAQFDADINPDKLS